jgi:hypothetical protein
MLLCDCFGTPFPQILCYARDASCGDTLEEMNQLRSRESHGAFTDLTRAE